MEEKYPMPPMPDKIVTKTKEKVVFQTTETRKEMECIQCIARDANKELMDRDDLDHYEKSMIKRRNTLKKN